MTAWNFFLPKKSSKHPQAKKFVEWFLKEDQQRQYLIKGGAPCRKSAFEKLNSKDWLPYFTAMRESYDYAVPKETFPEAEEIRMVLSYILHDMLLKKALKKQVNVEDHLDKAEQSIKKILSRGHVYWGKLT